MAVYKMTPTKANLIKAKQTSKLMKQGLDILDKKKQVLIIELGNEISVYETKKKAFEDKMEKIYKAIDQVSITMGAANLQDIANTIPIKDNLKIDTRSIMGVAVPKIEYKIEKLVLNYGFFETNALFDDSITEMSEAMQLIYDLAELETKVYNLKKEIKKLSKRTNSLEKVQIPKNDEVIKSIVQTLEEKEREEFFRTKQIKKISSKAVKVKVI